MADRSGRINLRVSPAEKEAWEDAAGGARAVSGWLRELANDAADLAIHNEIVARAIETPHVEVEPKPDRRYPKPASKCPRWMHHRPGVFCGSCPE